MSGARIRRWALALLAGAVLASCGTGAVTGSPHRAGPLPGGYLGQLPEHLPDHLGIGLAANLGPQGLKGWVPQSKIGFDYTSQYLAGGVNTGSGWETWDPRATFPIDYASLATSEHHVPVLDYYMLLQSNGPCNGCGEAQKDLARLNDRTVMADYYRDFATLMQRLGKGTWDGVKGFGGTVIVDVEPDLSGYAEQAVLDSSNCYGYCHGQGNDPSLLEAAVASTGVEQVSGYPDNYLGFNLALLHLRDLYAPNVLLAFHVSPWATGTDIASSTDPHLDATALGREAGQFAARSGVSTTRTGTSTYNLVFDDVGDRDAQLSGDWWDPTNKTFPNFSRWELYVSAAAEAFGKPMMAWQVPLGNEYFRTENGSPGHTRDNRIEYFFAHPRQLVDSGIVAVLYADGTAGSTTNWDADGDGVTNPVPVCTTERGVRACSTHVSKWPDDDGGYLRIQSAAYYKHPQPLSQASRG